jgi:hypothetical protein
MLNVQKMVHVYGKHLPSHGYDTAKQSLPYQEIYPHAALLSSLVAQPMNPASRAAAFLYICNLAIKRRTKIA